MSHVSNHVYLRGEGAGTRRLGEAIMDAYTEDSDVRILTGVNGEGLPYVKVKIGQGMWSPPIYSDDDPNRG